ncbi:MAG TPA: AraC family transcriptional regulator [Sphingomicrobium sp.]
MTRGRAKIAMGQGVSAWLLEAKDGFGDADFHAHHAIQITICLDGALSLETEAESRSGPVLAVAADTRHRFAAHGLLAFLFVEPESAAGRTLTAKLFGQSPLAAIDHAGFRQAMEPFRDAFDRDLSSGDMLSRAEQAIGQLAPITCTRRPDERIQRIIAFASDHLDKPLTLESASQGVFLSASRLRHLFVEQTGLAFRTYLLWLRLVRAVHLYSQGKSLTESAHGAGFADSAHFSRIFKRTFGLPATTLTRL